MSILSAVRDMDRLRQITQVLVSHGFGELVTRMGLSSGKEKEEGAAGARVARPQLGERLRLVLQDLGPTFVKLGQIMSTRSDVLPEDIISHLKHLQDKVAPFSAEEARRQIEETLGAPVESVFASFDPQPIASASIAQVHRATLKVNGQSEPVEVAVKIQRPGIAQTVQRDLDLLYLLARLIERTVAEARVYSPTGLVREFDQSITAELDFTIEAVNCARFAESFREEPAIRFPRVFNHASGRRVLALEYLDGLKVDQAVRLGASGEWIATNSIRILLKMIFEDGFFHADPHPGNVLIMPRPGENGYPPDQPLIIGLLDLGLVGRLSPELRDRTVDLLLGAARNDPEAMADALLAIGRPRKRVDQEAFRREVRLLADKHLGRPLKAMDATGVVRDLVTGAMKFDIEIPVELTMMLRAMMTMEGVGKEIYPELDVFAVAKPYLTRMLWQRFHPARLGAEVLRGAERLGGMARRLPFQIQEILDDLRNGRLYVRTDPASTRAAEQLGKRIRASVVFGVLFSSGMAIHLVRAQGGLRWVLMVGATLWLLLHLFADFWTGKKPPE